MKARIPQITKKQKAAVLEEARRQMAALLPIVIKNLEVIILWQLHTNCGFGKKRLMRFFDDMTAMVRDDLDFYNFSHDSDAVWLYKRNLKEIGIDLDSLKDPFLEKLDIDVK
jgi:hypothetical protein